MAALHNRKTGGPAPAFALTFRQVRILGMCVLGIRVGQGLLRGLLIAIALSTAATGLVSGGLTAEALGQTLRNEAETAALPRVNGLDSRGLPRVLSARDVARYREIFSLQEAGRWERADRLIAQLEDRRLLGHVQFQRYMHPTAYRSSYKELRRWLASYADHPEAERIHRLALRRKPAGAAAPRAPEGARISLGGAGAELFRYVSPRSRSADEAARVEQIKRRIRRNVLSERLTVTEKLLNSAEVRGLLDEVERAQGFGRVASGWFYLGRDAKALAAARTAVRLGGDKAPVALWVGGLAAWRSGDAETAYGRFAALAQAGHVSGWMRAAGGFWASRSALRLRRPGEMSGWLRTAAAHPRTFYGLLAREALGMDTELSFGQAPIDRPGLSRLLQDQRALRAAALLQVGQRERAEAELMMLDGWSDEETARALVALTERAQFPGLAYRLGSHLDRDPTQAADPAITAALFPIPPWEPTSGWQVDRALLYALMRQESAFDPEAESPYGARGLMQLMPTTASYIAGDRSLRGSARAKLFEPAFNLDLAQRYLLHLMEETETGNDLFRLAAAYNGGPGNLRKWQRRLQEAGVPLDDPLLFIESLPSLETRLFIERVLTNLWIYRARLGQPAPSLEALAAGVRPIYVKLD